MLQVSLTPNRGDMIKVQRLQRNCFKWIDDKQTYHTLTKIPALTSPPYAANAGSTSIQEVDFWSVRLSNLGLRVSKPEERKIRTA